MLHPTKLMKHTKQLIGVNRNMPRPFAPPNFKLTHYHALSHLDMIRSGADILPWRAVLTFGPALGLPQAA